MPGCSWARGFTAAANEACSAWDGCASRWRHVCRTRHYSRSSGGRHFSRTKRRLLVATRLDAQALSTRMLCISAVHAYVACHYAHGVAILLHVPKHFRIPAG